MADPIYNRFEIKSTTSECIQAPADPGKDPCKIQVEDSSSDLFFLLERKNNAYQPATADASKVVKAYPNYSAPMKELSDYLLVKSEIYKVLGDEQNPSDITKKVSFENSEYDKNKIIFGLMNTLSNFISHGQLDPKNAKMKSLEEDTIKAAVYSFGDPVLGTLVQKILNVLKDNANLAPQSRKRVEWLLGIYAAREKFWSAMKPTMDKSQNISNVLKKRSVNILVFLFANHILAEKGYNEYLFSNEVKEAAKNYDQVLSQVDDANYDASKNFYAFIKSMMSALKTSAIPEDYKKDFLQRVSFIESEYEKAGKQEMVSLLGNMSAEQAFRQYVLIRYDDTQLRAQVLGIILKNMTLKAGTDGPTFTFAMDKINKELKTWANGQGPDKKKEAVESILYILKSLFERDGKMEVFWDKKIQEMDNFYTTGNFPVVGPNKTALEDLIVWARGAASDSKLFLPPSEIPHVSLRKWTLGTEIGLGLLGTGGAIATQFAVKDPQARYYSQGGSIILGSSALGAAGGNLLSYKLDVASKHAWLFDAGGAILGGLLGGLIYGLAAKPAGPMGNIPGADTKYPVDPYGP